MVRITRYLEKAAEFTSLLNVTRELLTLDCCTYNDELTIENVEELYLANQA